MFRSINININRQGRFVRLAKRWLRTARRVLALILAVQLVAPEAMAALDGFGRSRVIDPAPGFSIESLAADPSLFIPSGPVTLSETHRGVNGRLIIHIQDAHNNPGAQLNLAEALEEIFAACPARLVLVEGGTGDDSLSHLRSAASPEVRKRVAARFLEKGEISGEEYLSLAGERDFAIWGIESPDLYALSLEYYRDTVAARREALEYLEIVRKAHETVRSRVLAPTALRFEKRVEAFKDISAHADYAAFLTDYAGAAGVDLGEYPELTRVDRIRRAERSLDLSRAESERVRLLESRGALPSARGGRGNSQGAVEFLSGDEAARYPEFGKYLRYAAEARSLDLARLWQEMEGVEGRILERLLNGPESVHVSRMSREIELLERFYALKLRPHEYIDYLREPLAKDVFGWTAFLNRKLVDWNLPAESVPYRDAAEKNRDAVIRFYESVSDRDDEFVRRAKQRMDQTGETAAILIAGGYHTPNLTRKLKEAGYSFVVLTPHADQATDRDLYERLLLGRRSETGSAASAESPRNSKAHTIRVRAARERIEPVILGRLREGMTRRESKSASRLAVRDQEAKGIVSRAKQAVGRYWKRVTALLAVSLVGLGGSAYVVWTAYERVIQDIPVRVNLAAEWPALSFEYLPDPAPAADVEFSHRLHQALRALRASDRVRFAQLKGIQILTVKDQAGENAKIEARIEEHQGSDLFVNPPLVIRMDDASKKREDLRALQHAIAGRAVEDREFYSRLFAVSPYLAAALLITLGSAYWLGYRPVSTSLRERKKELPGRPDASTTAHLSRQRERRDGEWRDRQKEGARLSATDHPQTQPEAGSFRHFPAYQQAYDSIRSRSSGFVAGFGDEWVTRAPKMLAADGGIRPFAELASAEVPGVSEVYFLPPSETRRRMQTVLDRLRAHPILGPKLFFIQPANLHLTVQGLEYSLQSPNGRLFGDEGTPVMKRIARPNPHPESAAPSVEIRDLIRYAQGMPTPSEAFRVSRLSWDPDIGIFWEVEPYLENPAWDPLMQRRAAWEVVVPPNPRPPHITAAYFQKGLSADETRMLNEFLASYQDPDYFGDIEMDRLRVILYDDYAYHTGYRALATVDLETVISRAQLARELSAAYKRIDAAFEERFQRISRELASGSPAGPILNPSRLQIMRKNFKKVAGSDALLTDSYGAVPSDVRIYPTFISFPTNEPLNRFLKNVNDLVRSALPEGVDYYQVPESDFHISVFVARERRGEDEGDESQEDDFDDDRKAAYLASLDRVADLIGREFWISLAGVKMNLDDGSIIAVFKDEGEIQEIRKRLAASNADLKDSGSVKTLIHVTLFRVLSDIPQDTLFKLKYIIDHANDSIARSTVRHRVDALVSGEETQWMHRRMERGSEVRTVIGKNRRAKPTASRLAGPVLPIWELRPIEKHHPIYPSAYPQPYIFSNESGTDGMVRDLQELSRPVTPVIHVGFSGFLNLDIMAARKSEYGILLDQNERQIALWRMVRTLLERHADRKSFIRHFVGSVSQTELNSPGSFFRYEDPVTLTQIRRKLASFQSGWQRIYETSWLATDEGYRHIRRMFMEGRVVHLQADIRDDAAFEYIGEWIKRYGPGADTVYVSNIREWVSGERYKEFLPPPAEAEEDLTKMNRSIEALSGAGTIHIEAWRTDRSRDRAVVHHFRRSGARLADGTDGSSGPKFGAPSFDARMQPLAADSVSGFPAPRSVRLSDQWPEDFVILVPAYNESANIADYIREVARQGYLERVIWVNDGSTDDTALKLSENPQVRFIDYRVNQQKEGALAAALEYLSGQYAARGAKRPEYFVAVDADTFLRTPDGAAVIPALSRMVARMKEQDISAASLNILAHLPHRFIPLAAALQALYWRLSQIVAVSRFLKLWPNIPGGGTVYRTEHFLSAMRESTTGFEQRPMELRRIFKAKNYRIDFRNLSVEARTEVFDSFARYFSERKKWVTALVREARPFAYPYIVAVDAMAVLHASNGKVLVATTALVFSLFAAAKIYLWVRGALKRRDSGPSDIRLAEAAVLGPAYVLTQFGVTMALANVILFEDLAHWLRSRSEGPTDAPGSRLSDAYDLSWSRYNGLHRQKISEAIERQIRRASGGKPRVLFVTRGKYLGLWTEMDRIYGDRLEMSLLDLDAEPKYGFMNLFQNISDAAMTDSLREFLDWTGFGRGAGSPEEGRYESQKFDLILSAPAVAAGLQPRAYLEWLKRHLNQKGEYFVDFDMGFEIGDLEPPVFFNQLNTADQPEYDPYWLNIPGLTAAEETFRFAGLHVTNHFPEKITMPIASSPIPSPSNEAIGRDRLTLEKAPRVVRLAAFDPERSSTPERTQAMRPVADDEGWPALEASVVVDYSRTATDEEIRFLGLGVSYQVGPEGEWFEGTSRKFKNDIYNPGMHGALSIRFHYRVPADATRIALRPLYRGIPYPDAESAFDIKPLGPQGARLAQFWKRLVSSLRPWESPARESDPAPYRVVEKSPKSVRITVDRIAGAPDALNLELSEREITEWLGHLPGIDDAVVMGRVWDSVSKDTLSLSVYDPSARLLIDVILHAEAEGGVLISTGNFDKILIEELSAQKGGPHNASASIRWAEREMWRRLYRILERRGFRYIRATAIAKSRPYFETVGFTENSSRSQPGQDKYAMYRYLNPSVPAPDASARLAETRVLTLDDEVAADEAVRDFVASGGDHRVAVLDLDDFTRVKDRLGRLGSFDAIDRLIQLHAPGPFLAVRVSYSDDYLLLARSSDISSEKWQKALEATVGDIPGISGQITGDPDSIVGATAFAISDPMGGAEVARFMDDRYRFAKWGKRVLGKGVAHAVSRAQMQMIIQETGSRLADSETVINDFDRLKDGVYFDQAMRERVSTVVIDEARTGLSWPVISNYPFVDYRRAFPNARIILVGENHYFDILKSVEGYERRVRYDLDADEPGLVLWVNATPDPFESHRGSIIHLDTFETYVAVRTPEDRRFAFGNMARWAAWDAKAVDDALKGLGLGEFVVRKLDDSFLSETVADRRQSIQEDIALQARLSLDELRRRPIILFNPMYSYGVFNDETNSDVWADAASKILTQIPEAVLVVNEGITERMASRAREVRDRIILSPDADARVLSMRNDITDLAAVLSLPNAFVVTEHSGVGLLAEVMDVRGVKFTDREEEYTMVDYRPDLRLGRFEFQEDQGWLEYLNQAVRAQFASETRSNKPAPSSARLAAGAPPKLDPSQIPIQEKRFLDAVDYFNQSILGAESWKEIPDLTPQQVLELFERIRGERENWRYLESEDRNLRLKLIRGLMAPGGPLALVNARFSEPFGEGDVRTRLKQIHDAWVANQPFQGAPGFTQFLPQQSPSFDSPHPASGHNRLGLFARNFFLARNGYQPNVFGRSLESGDQAPLIRIPDSGVGARLADQFGRAETERSGGGAPVSAEDRSFIFSLAQGVAAGAAYKSRDGYALELSVQDALVTPKVLANRSLEVTATGRDGRAIGRWVLGADELLTRRRQAPKAAPRDPEMAQKISLYLAAREKNPIDVTRAHAPESAIAVVVPFPTQILTMVSGGRQDALREAVKLYVIDAAEFLAETARGPARFELPPVQMAPVVDAVVAELKIHYKDARDAKGARKLEALIANWDAPEPSLPSAVPLRLKAAGGSSEGSGIHLWVGLNRNGEADGGFEAVPFLALLRFGRDAAVDGFGARSRELSDRLVSRWENLSGRAIDLKGRADLSTALEGNLIDPELAARPLFRIDWKDLLHFTAPLLRSISSSA